MTLTEQYKLWNGSGKRLIGDKDRQQDVENLADIVVEHEGWNLSQIKRGKLTSRRPVHSMLFPGIIWPIPTLTPDNKESIGRMFGNYYVPRNQ